ncbi:MAG: serine hydrolase [Luteimonas sp.]
MTQLLTPGLRPIRRIRRAAVSLLLALLTATGTAVAAEAEQDLDSFVLEAMRRWSIPGVAVAVVQEDKLVFAKGYGVRQLGRSERVDENSTFGIGSVTKSFTTAATAMLVDEGKLAWDAPIIDYLPAYRLSDPWLTANASIRDLVSHRIGIEAPLDQLRNGSHEHSVRATRYMRPAAPFRSFYYSNVGYATLGQVIDDVSGSTWDDFVAGRIFEPLGMTQSHTSEHGFIDADKLANCWLCTPPPGTPLGRDALGNRNDNRAVPHAALAEMGATERQVRVVPWRSERVVVSAGLINSTARDMAQWMRLHLNGGEYQGRRLISAERMNDLHSAQIVAPPFARTPGFKPTGYGMGLSLGTYRGFAAIQHGGGRVGYGAMVWMFPERKLGIVYLQNIDQRDGPPLDLIALRFADHYLGIAHTPEDDRKALEGVPFPAMASGTRHPQCSASAPRANQAELRRYEGAYRNEAVGEARVAREGDHLALTIVDGAVMDLRPAPGGDFTECFRGHEQEPTPLRFIHDSKGSVVEFALGDDKPGALIDELRFRRPTAPAESSSQ